MQPMPRVPPFDRPATYEDLVALPDLYVAEIVGGELYASRPLAPVPNVARPALHAMVGRAYGFGQDGPGGWRCSRRQPSRWTVRRSSRSTPERAWNTRGFWTRMPRRSSDFVSRTGIGPCMVSTVGTRSCAPSRSARSTSSFGCSGPDRRRRSVSPVWRFADDSAFCVD